jgi:hypothetical protein
LLWGADEALDVLRLALAAYDSSTRGGVGVNPEDVSIADTGNAALA